MTLTVTRLRAWEILDSRGRPTLNVSRTPNRAEHTAGAPSGASTDRREAVELRNHDPHRYSGAGVLTAVGHFNGEIASYPVGRKFADQASIDAVRARWHPGGTRTYRITPGKPEPSARARDPYRQIFDRQEQPNAPVAQHDPETIDEED